MPINRHRWTKAAGGGAATSVTAAAFPLLAPDGTIGAPSYSFSGATNAGIRYNNGSMSIVDEGVEQAALDQFNQGLKFPNSGGLAWTSGATPSGSDIDTRIVRNAAGVIAAAAGAGTPTSGGWWMGDAGKTRLAANHTVATNSTVLAAINNLTCTVVAGRHYRFRASLYFTTVNTSGVKVAVSGTATHTDIVYDVIIHGISTPSFLTSGRATAKDTAVGVTASGTAANVVIEGFTTINAGGTLLLQAAQNAETGAAESVIALRGCTWEVTDFA